MLILNRRTTFVLIASIAFAFPALAEDKPKPKIEFRRAEATAAEGLTEATVVSTKEKVYLYKKVDLTASDIKSVATSDDPKDPSILFNFTEAGAKKAEKMCEGHRSKPIAFMVDGKVIAAPLLHVRFSSAARISLRLTEAEVKKIVKVIEKAIEK